MGVFLSLSDRWLLSRSWASFASHLGIVDLEVVPVVDHSIPDRVPVIFDPCRVGEPLHGLFDGQVIGEHVLAAQRLVDAPAVLSQAGNPGAAALGAPEADIAPGDDLVPVGFPPGCQPVALGGGVDRIA